MSHRSRAASFSWSSAKRSLQADRVQVPAGFLGARGRIEVAARLGKVALVKADGSFDRAGIMKAAAQAADAHQARFGCSRREALSVALKAAWQKGAAQDALWAHIDGVLFQTVPATAAGCVALARFALLYRKNQGVPIHDDETVILSLIDRSPAL